MDHSEQAQLFHRADPEMFNIPLVINMDNRSLHILSNSQKFLNGVPKHMLPKPQEGASSASSLPPSSPPVGEELPVQRHAPMNVAAICHARHPSLVASCHSSPPSSPTAEPLQPSAQRCGSVNMAAIRHGHRPQAGSHHSTAPSPTAHSPPPPLAQGHVPSHISLMSHLPTVWHTHCSTPSPPCCQHAAHTRCSCSPTPRPQHRNWLQSHKCCREYPEDGSDDGAHAQGRAHHRYVLILAYTLLSA